MFKCQKCHEISYSRYEEYIYVCQDCKRCLLAVGFLGALSQAI
jgi:ribosomal protein L37AE/L43A